MIDQCIQCQLRVTENQEAVLCEECDRWQHRTCDSGVSRAEYLAAVREGTLEWVCAECRQDVGLYAADLGEFAEPAEQEDIQLIDHQPLPQPLMLPDDNAIRYTILQGTTGRGKDMLVDSIGYQYNKKVDKRRANVTWRCCVRNKTTMCRATVLERDGQFVRGSQHHICTAEPGREAVAVFRLNMKDKAADRPFESAAEIIEQALRDEIGVGNIAMHPTLPKPVNLAQQANRKRKLNRPNQPTDLDFILDDNHIAPGFMKQDVRVDGLRHLMFATDDMLSLLRRSHIWYVDATFKLVKAPFTQLFSIHSFIESGVCTKQVPLMFVMMSGRRIQDYQAVLRAALGLLPRPIITKVLADYESSMWQALRVVLPNTKLTGCLFHFTQCVFRKVQEFGLQVDYRNDVGTRTVVRQCMALPLLPHEHITEVFDVIKRNAGNSPPIRRLLDYFQSTWIVGTVFTPPDWTCYNQKVRTNNDLEGWHYRLNHRGRRGNLQFYLMGQLLYEEAVTVSITAELVNREDVTRSQTIGAARSTAKLLRMWEQYRGGQRSARSLLAVGSRIVSHHTRE